LATPIEVWVPIVTFLALALVPTPAFGMIKAVTIILACEILFVLSFFTCLIAYCPIKHQWNHFVRYIFEITGGEVELAFFDNKSVAAGIEVQYLGVILIAIYLHTNIL